MLKSFSFSLYDAGGHGVTKRYVYNMVANVLIAQKLFPDWKLYIYYDNSLKKNIINFLLRSPNVVAKDMSNHWLTKCDKMMWRNMTIDDHTLDIVCIRDCDGWLSYREKVILDDWVKNDKDFHIIRDHCWHKHKIGGGLWGRKNSLKLNIEEKMKEYFFKNKNHRSHSGEDQDFLVDNYYEQYKENTIVYIGQQYEGGTLLPRGYRPNEHIKRINDLINMDEFIQDKSKHEIIEGLSLVEISKLNEFRCGRCSKKFHVFIGDMFKKLPDKAIKLIEDNLLILYNII